MIKCPHCDSVYPENTLFCEECGSYLAPASEHATDPLYGQTSGEVDGDRTDKTKYRMLALSIEGGGTVELPLSKEVVLGRLDASRAIFPDVDLSSEDGLERGVSRRHARISRRGSDVFIEDLNSLNGTFLNASRLVPELPYPLTDGDQIQLGKLIVAVHLK
jgi:hypothetical protein